MNACLSCGADLTHDICDFCFAQTPQALAPWLRPEAVTLMRRHAHASRFSVTPRSKFYRIARSLQDLKIFRFAGPNVYDWTEYGRAALREASVEKERKQCA